jgi:hypothetical protein
MDDDNKSHVTKLTWLIVGLAFGLSSLTLLTAPRGQTTPGAFYVSLLMSTIVALLHFGIPIIFWYGLKNFQSGLRAAYKTICLGIIILGLAHLQQPIISMLDQWNSWWVRGGFIALPYFLAVIWIFVGVSKFAKLVRVGGWITRLWPVLGLTLLTAVAAAFLPHVDVEVPQEEFMLTLALSGWDVAFSACAGLVVLKIKRQTSLLYTHALGWFLLAWQTLTLAFFLYVVSILVFPVDHWYEDYSVAMVPFLASALLMVKAGHAFVMIGRPVSMRYFTKFFGAQPKNAVQAAKSSPIDLIVYMTTQVSSPQDIDPILDELRDITSRLPINHDSGEQLLSEQSQIRLAQVYLKIETYLLTQERLRVFTQESIRNSIRDNYPLSPERYGVFLRSIAITTTSST